MGTLASVSGFQVVRFGQFWLMYQLTGSLLALGYVGFGGVFADKVDLRRLVLTTQVLVAGLIFLLATLTLLDLVQVWHVLVIAFLAGAVNAFDEPARQALYPHLIDRKVMMSAVALILRSGRGTALSPPL